MMSGIIPAKSYQFVAMPFGRRQAPKIAPNSPGAEKPEAGLASKS
jgi:hypothetical protein